MRRTLRPRRAEQLPLLPPTSRSVRTFAIAPSVAAFAAALARHKAESRHAIHGFHRWHGKLIPAIPGAAIEAFTEPGDIVVDPFCGSGTTLVEALLAGRRAIGADIHPLATLLSRVKTRAADPAVLSEAAERVLARAMEGPASGWRERLPPLPKVEHYYPDDVASDLIALYEAARDEPDEPAREFLLATASAINRDVSNADTRHVFPGVSKRMRALIAEGWRADVPLRAGRALRKRVRVATELHAACEGHARPVVVQALAQDFLEVAASAGVAGRAALVVTNPPYVSSIRYVETMRLETLWLGACRDTRALQALDATILGTERVGKAPLDDAEIDAVQPSEGREAVARLRGAGEHRMARTLAAYLVGLATSMNAVAKVLRPGGHAVVKLAPSRIRGESFDTPAACASLLERQGVGLLATVDDAYHATSRSLTTARNWYSGRMDADALLVLRKDA